MATKNKGIPRQFFTLHRHGSWQVLPLEGGDAQDGFTQCRPGARRKIAMSTLGAVPVTSVAQANQVQSRQQAAQARATWRASNAIGAANEEKAAKTTTASSSPSDALGGVAVATTVAAMMSSMPAALHLMTHAAFSNAGDKPKAASSSISPDAYAQLTQRVASPGGSMGAGMQTGSSSTGQRGGSSPEDDLAGDADGADATQTAGNTAQARAQFSRSDTLAMAPAVDTSANPAVASAVAALAAPTRNGSAPGTQAMTVVEDAAPARASILTGLGARQAIAQFKQNVTSIRIPMSVVSLVA